MWDSVQTAKPEIEILRGRIERLLVQDLRYSFEFSSSVANKICEQMTRGGGNAYAPLHRMLDTSGVRSRWNATFRYHRAAAIAQWILPYVEGDVVDVLGGDGRIACVLSEYGVPVTVTERPGISESYARFDTKHLKWVDHDAFATPDSSQLYDTVLFSTALHHEPDAMSLLKLASRIARKRIIIIENCIEDGLSDSFHILLDDFFNLCLNQTPLPCPGQHRTLGQWLRHIEQIGIPIIVDRRGELPGIPVSHHLIVAEMPHAAK